MRKASMVLGIVGGSICLFVALIFAFVLFLGLAAFPDIEYYFDGSDTIENMSLALSAPMLPVADTETETFVLGMLPFFISAFVAGGLGIAGGIIVRKKNIASGVMFIIAAISSFYIFVSMVCFILAAIFAFVKDRPKPRPYYPPGSPYYPYPPYPYYPPQGMPGYGPSNVPQAPYGQQPQYPQPQGQYPPPYGQQPYPPQPPVQQEVPPADPPAPAQDSGPDQPQR